MRKIIPLLLSLILLSNAWPTQAATEDDIEDSIWFYRHKAEFKQIKKEQGFSRKITIGGLEVSDLELAHKLMRNELVKSIESQQFQHRIFLGSLAGFGTGLGIILLNVSNIPPEDMPSSQNNTLLTFNNQRFSTTNTGAIAGNLLGTLMTTLGIYFFVQLLNDISGISQQRFLDDQTVLNMVEEYNEHLKEKFRTEHIHGKYSQPMLQFSQRF